MLWPEWMRRSGRRWENGGGSAAVRRPVSSSLLGRVGSSGVGSVAICYLNGVDIAEVMVRTRVAHACPQFSGGRYHLAEAQAAAACATMRWRLPGYLR